MSGNLKGNGCERSGADTRLESLDREIRRLEDRVATWVDPVARTRLEAIRKRRARVERTRLAMGWSMLGTDGSRL